MFLIAVCISIYVSVALLAAMMTYSEQHQGHSRSPVLNALGFLACAFWPLTLVTVAIAVQRQSS